MTDTASAGRVTHIALEVPRLEQLFAFDPSPDHEHSLRQRISEYIVSEGWTAPRFSGFVIDLSVNNQPASADAVAQLQKAIASHFSHMADMKADEFSDIMRTGVISLGIGITALTVCTTLAQFVDAAPIRDGLREGLRDGLSMFGWVANWRPAELLLYDWWPVRRERNLYRRLAEATVQPGTARPKR